MRRGKYSTDHTGATGLCDPPAACCLCSKGVASHAVSRRRRRVVHPAVLLTHVNVCCFGPFAIVAGVVKRHVLGRRGSRATPSGDAWDEVIDYIEREQHGVCVCVNVCVRACVCARPLLPAGVLRRIYFDGPAHLNLRAASWRRRGVTRIPRSWTPGMARTTSQGRARQRTSGRLRRKG